MPDAPSPAQQAASRDQRCPLPRPRHRRRQGPRRQERHLPRPARRCLRPAARRGHERAGAVAPGRRRRLAVRAMPTSGTGRPSWWPPCGASSACAGSSSRPSTQPRRRARPPGHPEAPARLRPLRRPRRKATWAAPSRRCAPSRPAPTPTFRQLRARANPSPPPNPRHPAARTPEPERPTAPPRASASAALPTNRHERRRLEALARSAQRRAA